MKKFVVSNRVFWAGVVLTSAALIGRNGGQAQPPASPVLDEIKARGLTLVDSKGRAAIIMGASSDDSTIIEIGVGGKSGKIKIATDPQRGATILFDDKDKPTRLITAYASKDLNKRPPSSK